MKANQLAVINGMRLIDQKTHETLYYGQRVVTFKGEIGTLEWAGPPVHPGSTGRVYVRQAGASYLSEWFPSVIGAEWVAA